MSCSESFRTEAVESNSGTGSVIASELFSLKENSGSASQTRLPKKASN